MVVNIYAPNIWAPGFIKQTLKHHRCPDTTVGDFTHVFSKLKVIKETSGLNYTIDQLSLIAVYRVVHPTDREYI